MMEDEQNLKKIPSIVQKHPKRYIKKKEKTYQYIVKATQMPKVTSTNTMQYQ